jgi:hypothetical protein
LMAIWPRREERLLLPMPQAPAAGAVAKVGRVPVTPAIGSATGGGCTGVCAAVVPAPVSTGRGPATAGGRTAVRAGVGPSPVMRAIGTAQVSPVQLRERPQAAPAESVLVKLETDNPDVVIYWIAETKGETK